MRRVKISQRALFCDVVQICFRVALMQLAVKDKAYLLDISALIKIFTAQDWENFAQHLFCNEHILKLGKILHSRAQSNLSRLVSP